MNGDKIQGLARRSRVERQSKVRTHGVDRGRCRSTFLIEEDLDPSEQYNEKRVARFSTEIGRGGLSRKGQSTYLGPMVPTRGVPIPNNACPMTSRGYPLLGLAVPATRNQHPRVPMSAPSQQQYLTPIFWIIQGTKKPAREIAPRDGRLGRRTWKRVVLRTDHD